MKEALRSSETSVLTRATRLTIPEDTILQAVSDFVNYSMDCCSVEWFSRKPNWYGGISLLSGTASSILLRSSLSDALAVMVRRSMGLYDVTSVGEFPGEDNMTI
jgi:hypothetical protein